MAIATTNNPNALGTQPVGKLLARYAVPAIIAMVSNSLYNIADSIFIGHGVGSMALSGLGITMPFSNLCAAFGAMVGVGAASLTSIRLGQGNKARAFLILSNALMLNIILGTLTSVLGLIFLEPLLTLFGASEQTMPYAREYMRILLFGNIVTHVYLGFNEILRASGYPKKAMAIMLTAIIINCGLDALFIFVFKWGIMGAALATVMAQCLAFVLELTHFLNKKHFLYIKAGTFRLVGVIIKKILAIGAAPFLVNVCSSIVVLFINRALRDYGGDISIGAYSIVNRIVMLFIMIVAGFNQGMQPIVGFNFGARQFDRVLKVLRLTIICAVSVTTIGFLFCQLFPHIVVGMFTSDPTLLAVAEEGLRIIVLALPIVGFQIVSSNFFQYIGQPRKAIVLSTTRQLLFLVPMLLLLPPKFGTMGVWMTMPIADVLAAMLTAVLLFVQIRKIRRNPDSIRVI